LQPGQCLGDIIARFAAVHRHQFGRDRQQILDARAQNAVVHRRQHQPHLVNFLLNGGKGRDQLLTTLPAWGHGRRCRRGAHGLPAGTP
jgi:hypothetical protein